VFDESFLGRINGRLEERSLYDEHLDSSQSLGMTVTENRKTLLGDCGLGRFLDLNGAGQIEGQETDGR
jgi:hypothetical protein